MTNAISSFSNTAVNAFNSVKDRLDPRQILANLSAKKVCKIALATLAMNAVSNIPAAAAGPITAWVAFGGCLAATIWVPWFMVECPEVALIAAALPTP